MAGSLKRRLLQLAAVAVLTAIVLIFVSPVTPSLLTTLQSQQAALMTALALMAAAKTLWQLLDVSPIFRARSGPARCRLGSLGESRLVTPLLC